MRKKTLLWITASIMLTSAFKPAGRSVDQSWILVISDIHLSEQSTPSVFGKDTHADLWDWTLKKFDSVLEGKGGWHKPAFILCLGDLPCHKSNEPDPQKRAAYAHTVKEILQRRAAAAHVPIVFAPGNNDYPEEDYCATDTGYFARTLTAGGRNIKVIALNTVPYSPKDQCVAGKTFRQKDVDAQMTWLARQLEDIHGEEKAIIIMHIPPGKDGFKKAANESLWDSALPVQRQFLGIVAANKGKIAGILAGHSHKDGLRILRNADTSAGVLFSIPSISPVYNNNPGFKMISYNPSTLEWDNCTTFFTDLDAYTRTGTWDLHAYDLRTQLGLQEGPLTDAILARSSDSMGIADAIKPIYYVKSKCPQVEAMDSIERTIFVSAVAIPSPSSQLSPASQPSSPSDSVTFLLHKFAQHIGEERYTLRHTDSGLVYDVAFKFTDRGRAVPLTTRLTLTNSFEPVSLYIKGNTSRFSTINDTVRVQGGTAFIKVDDSSYQRELAPNSFPVAGYSPGTVQMALLKYWQTHGQPESIPILPEGVVKIRKDGTDELQGAAGPDRLSAGAGPGVAGGLHLDRYVVSGLVWGNELVWTLPDGQLVCLITNDAEGDKLEMMLEPYESLLPELLKRAAGYGMQLFSREIDASASGREIPSSSGKVATAASGKMTTAASGKSGLPQRTPLAIVGGTLVDVKTGTATENSVILLDNGVIKAVGKTGELTIPKNYTVIHAEGKTIFPGLWDMHAHFEQAEWGPAYLAAGVTTVRDCGNEYDYINAIQVVIDRGGGVGPHILKAGIIDGPGAMGLGIIRASTPEEAIAAVRKYKENGFVQIKIYSSVTPPVVKAICTEAHRLGLTVTGHIPEGMSLQQGVDSGMDMVNHIQYVYGVMKKDKDKRIDLTDSANRQVLHFIKEHGTVIDPTLGVFEMVFRSTKDDITTMEPAFYTLPLPLQALFKNIGMAPDVAAKYKPVLDGMSKIVKALHDEGVPLVAGTDMGFPGYSLDRELELYVAAGLTPLEAIQTATLIPARVMKMDKVTGYIAPGLRADLIFIEGDPLTNVRDIRNVRMVVKDGQLYDPVALHGLAGFGK